jgi:hypothetical protein
MKNLILFLVTIFALSSCSTDLVVQQGLSEKTLRSSRDAASVAYQDIEGIESPIDQGAQSDFEENLQASLSPKSAPINSKVKIEWNNYGFVAESVSLHGRTLLFQNIHAGAAFFQAPSLAPDGNPLEGIYQILVVFTNGRSFVTKTLDIYLTSNDVNPATVVGLN